MKLNNEIFPILFVGYNLKFSLFISLYIYLRCNTYIFLRNYSHLCSDLRIIIYSRKFIPSLIDLYISRSLKFIVGNNNNNNINDEHPYIYIIFCRKMEQKEKRRDKRLISGGSTQRGSRAPCIDVHRVKKNATTLNVRSDQLESYSSPFIFRWWLENRVGRMGQKWEGILRATYLNVSDGNNYACHWGPRF